ncbi:hypothetical protein COCSUDRAFT_44822 [Coccomyxa subellipsoidea C-169]|uniref:Uncharacterized protein n=1 Tax=Coccomyxa subellipsoidea (strain C-169) TaxID=574566 RepID=I0YKW6_COCSC|nr:hypothetical protein COCSUDRAFT_44822 [Coccomyxa subellipsoidea C-169]EIE19035.1 hypothetical protein COCSUDRAFT_44822 [Coccomyxa subellipsoidea C-169]|eukprot:XP_005643579.1 hypothetical protein COCSUDRAFT_44822 [Coccomyxa subellipsoidea C-169]
MKSRTCTLAAGILKFAFNAVIAGAVLSLNFDAADGANITDFFTDGGSALLNALPLTKEAFHTYKAAEDADDAAKAARLAAVEAQLQAFQAEIDLLKRQVNNGSSASLETQGCAVIPAQLALLERQAQVAALGRLEQRGTQVELASQEIPVPQAPPANARNYILVLAKSVSRTVPPSFMPMTTISRLVADASLIQPFLYDFGDVTFTNAGAGGRSGPTLQQVQTTFAASGADPWTQNQEYLDVINGVQIWTVPQSGRYNISVGGAAGGGNLRLPAGLGAVVSAQVRLACGSKVAIIVGQTGLPVGPGTGACGGGGGATFFLYPNSTTPLVIAGGGASLTAGGQPGQAGQPGLGGNGGGGGTGAGGGGGTVGVTGSETYLGGITTGLTSSFGGFGAGGSAGDGAPCGGGGGAGYLAQLAAAAGNGFVTVVLL